MARLFTCGFEENNLAATTMGSGGTAPTITTTTPHSGTYRLECTPSANTSTLARSLASNKTSGTLFCRFYWMTSTISPAGTRVFFKTAGASNALLLTLLTTGAIRLTNSVSGTTQDTATGILSTNTWYRIEVRHLLSDTVGEMEFRIYLGDSVNLLVSALSITGEDTLPTNINGVTYGVQTSASSITMSYDDVAINDESGSFQNSWPGPAKICLLKPNGDTTAQWTKSGSSPAATNFGGVSEVPGAVDDGVTYNEDSGTTNLDKLALTDTPTEVVPTATIILADIVGRHQANANSQNMSFLFYDELGNQNVGPSIGLSNGSWTYSSTSQHMVFDATGKTKANVDAFSVGYKGVSGASAKRVTSVWVQIEWIEANYYNVSPPKVVGQSVKRASYF